MKKYGICVRKFDEKRRTTTNRLAYLDNIYERNNETDDKRYRRHVDIERCIYLQKNKDMWRALIIF